MKRKLRATILLLSPILLCLYFLAYNVIMSQIWSNFFQTGEEIVFKNQFIAILILPFLLICVIVVFVLAALQTLFYLVKKEKDSLKVSLVHLLLILFLPFLGALISKSTGNDKPVLTSLKNSFEKEEIDTLRITEWLNELNDEVKLPCSLMDLEKSMIPADIQEMLESYLEKTYLLSDMNGKPGLEMRFFSLYAAVGVVIGYSPDESAQSVDPFQSIDLNEKCFIWIELG